MSVHLFGEIGQAAVFEIAIASKAGASAKILSWGAVLRDLVVPSARGPQRVTLGLNTIGDYLEHSPSFGAVPGRFANRIANGRFALDGTLYELERKPEEKHTLHGGPNGFGRKIWKLGSVDASSVTLTLESPDGDAGFPGALTATCVYRLIEPATLRVELGAQCDRPTIVNLTQHAYFNLDGSSDVRDHELTLVSDFYTPTDAELIPTGEIRDIAGTPLDFRTPTAIGARIDEPDDHLQRGGGYDLNYVLADAPRAAPALAATLSAGGMVMTVLTTEPGLQFYSGNFLRGAPFAWRSACCLETQHFTDSLNHPAFPTTVLRPGERFASRTVYRFNAG